MELLWVVLAGGFGSVIRWFLAQFAGRLPWGILIANTAASLIAGLAITALPSNIWGTILVSGVCGGLSTFSSFAAQTHALIADKAYGRAALNVALNFLLPFAAALTGAVIGVQLLSTLLK